MTRFRPQLAAIALVLSVLILAGCEREHQTTSIGQAYAGPAKLNVRQELNLHSPVVATVNHGEELEILYQRRRFTRVRTQSGIEGWVDERNLMDAAQLADLQHRSTSLKNFPAQGQATVYDEVNVHTEPQRASPSYLIIKPAEKVEVLGHQWTARVDPPRKTLVKPPPKTVRARKPSPQPRFPPPPKPPAPVPPPDWLQLSKQRSLPKPPPPAAVEPEVPKDDWSLIRVASGQTGWVLTRNLTMAIPDEVAQYAEGHRITSYFKLGEVRDEDKVKETWLWTTVASGEHDFDFDSYRVFIWSLRHHRYETSYVQRHVRGYLPVLLNTVDGHPGFSICLENNATRTRRQYVMIENLVKSLGDSPCAPGMKPPIETRTATLPASPLRHTGGFADLVKQHFDLLRRTISGNQ